eukprot:CAMPEP_0171334166 /NCGR_PEP_ID=MMETSP0878-20121228/4494_1 /TAXON_ID=67004 /ORGANISM="Thalassiosira weissflogii, Strain CCMP1336" /LENGTH=74 /DNA_ID=CAMNT_0011835229 /DNA_START=106 /DNA_END=330 /DNA_ORIENTATION=+
MANSVEQFVRYFRDISSIDAYGIEVWVVGFDAAKKVFILGSDGHIQVSCRSNSNVGVNFRSDAREYSIEENIVD